MEQNQQRQVKDSPSLCSLPFRILGTLIVALFFSLIVEWIGIALFWQDQGAEHARLLMVEEFSWFSQEFQHSLIYNDPVKLMTQAMHTTTEWLWVKSGFNEWTKSHKGEFGHYLFTQLYVYIQASFYVIITFMIRLAIIVFTSPIFILAAMVGFVDGLVQRDLRRFGVGRESAFKYHHAKKMVLPTMFLAWTIYLSLPFSIYPNLIFVPSALFFGFIITYTTANFKKYL